jgi:general secretion pathway protein K
MNSLSSSNRPVRRRARRGGALLAVLWLSAAMAAIAFSVATNVRSEIERSITLVEGMQARYLAAGAIERTILWRYWGPAARNPDGTPRFGERNQSALVMNFPAGIAVVEVIPEAARLSLNRAPASDIQRLLLAMGVAPPQAAEITAGIIDWRNPIGQGGMGPFDSFYLNQAPSFRARHASIEETEEVLFVKGMTPDIFYGTWTRDAAGRLLRVGGFRDCVSPQGSLGTYDVVAAEPALLLSIGVPPAGVEQIRILRSQRPLTERDFPLLQSLAGPAAGRLRIGGNTIYTFRATARLRGPDGRLTETRRTLSATVKYFLNPVDPPYQIIRWNENAASEVAFWQ